MRIAILTSGGDSSGMNAVIRSVTRKAITEGYEVLGYLEGYEGLIDDNYVKLDWNFVSNIFCEGGTLLKSSRCQRFYIKEFRTKALLNLINNNVKVLIILGGDGSLRGALALHDELQENRALFGGKTIQIVGIAGSIDNDMPGTEYTIGADSALNRIIEAIDNITSTALSHQRAFIIEVMGRNCGWLALSAALAVDADWVFIPEIHSNLNWEEEMANKITTNRKNGKRATIVILAEGCIIQEGNQISSKSIISTLGKLGLDSRVTTLGHIQRGGKPSAFDRYLGTIQGIEAINLCLKTSFIEPKLICIRENKITSSNLRELLSNRENPSETNDLMRIRDHHFNHLYSVWSKFVSYNSPPNNAGIYRNILIVNCGAPCAGINAVISTIVKLGAKNNLMVYGTFSGFKGINDQNIIRLEIKNIDNWVAKGGCEIGIDRHVPYDSLDEVSKVIEAYSFKALIIIGGFEAFKSVSLLKRSSTQYKSFNIPIIGIPATISNNIPGSDFSIGSDTALNIIVNSCDTILQSACSSRQRIFVVDVQGGFCGYLATIGGLVSGASLVYIPEKPSDLNQLIHDIQFIKAKFRDNPKQGRLIIRNEKWSHIYTAEFLSKIFQEESNGLYDSRWIVLGHLQQGGNPSPMDRLRAIKYATKAIDIISQDLDMERPHDSGKSIHGFVGVQGDHLVFSNIEELENMANNKKRTSCFQWWLKHITDLDLLSGRFFIGSNQSPM